MTSPTENPSSDPTADGVDPQASTVAPSESADSDTGADAPSAEQQVQPGDARPQMSDGSSEVHRVEQLPCYIRSLLRINVPAVVTLAGKKSSLNSILDFEPGAIIQFDKSCEDMLDLAVGDHRIAVGEAVKVGDKFGLRVTSMVLPEERFETLRRAEERP